MRDAALGCLVAAVWPPVMFVLGVRRLANRPPAGVRRSERELQELRRRVGVPLLSGRELRELEREAGVLSATDEEVVE